MMVLLVVGVAALLGIGLLGAFAWVYRQTPDPFDDDADWLFEDADGNLRTRRPAPPPHRGVRLDDTEGER